MEPLRCAGVRPSNLPCCRLPLRHHSMSPLRLQPPGGVGQTCGQVRVGRAFSCLFGGGRSAESIESTTTISKIVTTAAPDMNRRYIRQTHPVRLALGRGKNIERQ